MILDRLLLVENRVKRIEQLLLESKKFEGGAAGHMSHVYDYTDLTLNNIKEIINNLLSGKIENITEKLDGMNIQCTMNNDGNVVFARNKGDINSPAGGMSPKDMAAKWVGKDHVAKTYLDAAEIITKVFNKVGKKFFNPNENTKRLVNCECRTAGKTNIIMYPNAQVNFLNLWTYTRKDANSEWKNTKVTDEGIGTLEKACEGIDGAKLVPKVTIDITEKSDELLNEYISQIDEIFGKEGLSDESSIDEYIAKRFNDICNKKYKWITENEAGQRALYNRWFNGDKKSMGIRDLKKIYKDHEDDLSELDKSGYKDIVSACIRPLDTFFSRFGNSIISLCKGMANAGFEDEAIKELKNDLESTVAAIKEKGSVEMNDKLTKQLDRLAELGDQINASEGIVFRYGDRLMKLTGSFAALNQILGMRYNM